MFKKQANEIISQKIKSNHKTRCKTDVTVAADTVVTLECTKFKIWGWTWHDKICEPDFMQLTVGDQGSRK